MASSAEVVRTLRASWLDVSEETRDDDFHLIASVRKGYASMTRAGLYALVIPLDVVGVHASGRRAAGCELTPIKSARFRLGNEEWEGAAASLVCIDNTVVDAFTVLAADVLSRIGDTPSWERIVEIVQEWQTLLTAKGKPYAEGELGLWGELWFLASASTPSALLAGWRGPERDSTDFFFDGRSAEVKTARQQRHHHVSMSQVSNPSGAHPAWLISIWVKEDPVRGRTADELVAALEATCEDHGDLHRRLLRAGYSSAARGTYVAKYVVLDEPEWYAIDDVPRIREADPGITDIRYRVLLDKDRALDAEAASVLWQHFLGRDYPGSTDEAG